MSTSKVEIPSDHLFFNLSVYTHTHTGTGTHIINADFKGTPARAAIVTCYLTVKQIV